MPQEIILYGTPVCPMLPPVIGLLKQAQIPYRYVNIHQDSAARARVREINHGYESVPTLEFPDGSTLTEPSTRALKARLEAEGYTIGPAAVLLGNGYLLLIAAGVILAVLRGFNVF